MTPPSRTNPLGRTPVAASSHIERSGGVLRVNAGCPSRDPTATATTCFSRRTCPNTGQNRFVSLQQLRLRSAAATAGMVAFGVLERTRPGRVAVNHRRGLCRVLMEDTSRGGVLVAVAVTTGRSEDQAVHAAAERPPSASACGRPSPVRFPSSWARCSRRALGGERDLVLMDVHPMGCRPRHRRLIGAAPLLATPERNHHGHPAPHPAGRVGVGRPRCHRPHRPSRTLCGTAAYAASLHPGLRGRAVAERRLPTLTRASVDARRRQSQCGSGERVVNPRWCWKALTNQSGSSPTPHPARRLDDDDQSGAVAMPNPASSGGGKFARHRTSSSSAC